MSNLRDMAWVTKYRPKKFENLLLTSSLRKRFESQEIDANLIIHGPFGTGKSSLVKILTKGYTTLEMNGSSENKIDDIRNIVEPFCKTSSILSGNKKKVCWIDEGDRLTIDAQKALKNIIEASENNVWFIITTNHPEKLTELYSRMPRVAFIPTDKAEINDLKKQYILRAINIIKNEGYSINKDAAIKVIDSNFPDFRTITGTLYEASKLTKEDKIITLEMVSKNIKVVNNSLYEFILSEHREPQLYQFIRSEYSGNEADALKSLGEPFLDFLYNNENDKIKQKVMGAAMITQKYIYESSTGAIDQLLPLLACVSALSKLLK